MACASGTDDKTGDSALNCPLCLTAYKMPRLLTCLHTFCQGCIESDIIKVAVSKKDAVVGMKCPVCEKVTAAPNSAKPPSEWAKDLPLNHAFLSVPESPIIETESRKLCGNCAKVDESEPADWFCTDCNEFQCKACVKAHRKFQGMESHNIVRLGEEDVARSAMINFGTVEFCGEHAGKVIEFYCEDHKVLCCSSCAIVSHRPCTKVVEIKALGEAARTVGKPQQLNSGIEATESQLDDVIKVLEANSSDIECQSDLVIQRMKRLRNTVVTLLDQLVLQVSSQCEALQSQTTAEINSKLSSDKTVRAAMVSSRALLQSVLKSGSTAQVFIAVQKVENHLRQYQTFVGDARDNVSAVELSLEVDQALKALSQSTTPLARAAVTRSHVELENQSDFEPLTPLADCVVQKLPLVHIPQQRGLNQPWYTGAVYLPDGRLVATDKNNSQCCLLDDSAKVTATIRLPSWPNDLAVTGEFEVAVVLPECKKIQYVTVGQCLRTSTSFDCNRTPYCVACISDKELVVGFDTGCGVIDRAGTEKHFLQTDDKGRMISFSQDSRIAVNAQTSMVYQSHYSNSAIYCFGLDGKEHFSYSEGMRGAIGVALDRDGNLYVCSLYNGQVHQVSPSGKRIRVIETGISNPYTLCFNPEGDQLLVFRGISSTHLLKVKFVPPS